jgi:tyrosinase
LELLEDRCLLSSLPSEITLTVPDPGPRSANAATVRKDASTLTDQERADFVNAVLALKNKYEDGSTISVYDEFVLLHQAAMTDHDIHVGPAFFPWHRELLDLFERELQTINPQVTIPYWNWAVDNQTTSKIWKSDFMGGDGDPRDNYIVKSGPFRQGQWTLITDGPDLRRSFGVNVSSLPTADDEQTALGISNYDVSPYDSGVSISDSFRNFMLGWNSPTIEPERHNKVHNWVGGSMLTESSPNDPVFWLVHANMDRIWSAWESQHGDLYPDSGAPDGENLNDQMPYLGVTPASVLSESDLGYSYDTEQSSPQATPAAASGRAAPAAVTPSARSAPLVVHLTNVGAGASLHQHKFALGGFATSNAEGLLQAVGLGFLALGGHLGHELIGGIGSPDSGWHAGPEAGHHGGTSWAPMGTASASRAAHGAHTVSHPLGHPPG